MIILFVNNLFFFLFIISIEFSFILASTNPIKESPVDEGKFYKNDNIKYSFFFKEMQIGGNTTSIYNNRTLKNKDGQYPSWLSGRQRKRLQAKQAVQKKIDKKKKTKTSTGKITKRKIQQKKNVLVKPETMLT
jgi:hypothetical protein